MRKIGGIYKTKDTNIHIISYFIPIEIKDDFLYYYMIFFDENIIVSNKLVQDYLKNNEINKNYFWKYYQYNIPFAFDNTCTYLGQIEKLSIENLKDVLHTLNEVYL